MANAIHFHNYRMAVRRQLWAVLSSLAFAGLLCFLLCSCDEHEPMDSNIHPGFVLCDGHQVVTLDAYRQDASLKAVGVVFAGATNDHPVLAVLLDELYPIEYADTLGLDFKTSGSVTDFDGYANSVAMRNGASKGYGSPLGEAVFDSHRFGQSDYVPSYAEARLLYQSLSVVNDVIREVGGTPVSTDSSDGSCWYWTSTEDNDDRGNRAWLCSMASGGLQQTPKTEAHPARIIVALNY